MGRSVGPRTLGPVSVALAAIGAGLLGMGIAAQVPAPPAPAPAPQIRAADVGARAAAPTSASPTSHAPPLSFSPPTRVRIDRLQISSETTDVGLTDTGQLQPPTDPDTVGWYTGGPAPGALGPAVLAAHVTWNGKAAAFYRLGDLRSGDRVTVGRQDGSTAVFEVEHIAQYAKDRFPTTEVYRNLDYAGLRLITCGGTYDKANHRYLDNVIAYARLVT